MLLTTDNVQAILQIHYKTILYKLRHNHFKTAKKLGRDWVIDSSEVLEMREKRLKQLADREKRKKLKELKKLKKIAI